MPAMTRGVLAADPDADAKPDWPAIAAASARRRRARLVAECLVAAHDECERRITAAYGAHSALHELQLRLAAPHGALAAADAERLRLAARYATIKAWLYPASHAAASYRRPLPPDESGPRPPPNSPCSIHPPTRSGATHGARRGALAATHRAARPHAAAAVRARPVEGQN